MRPGAVTASARLAGLLFLLVCAACGPKGVRSPDWLLAESARYPGGRFLVGVGSAPTAGGVAEALKAASASARAEIAQTIEVRIDHVQELLGQNVTERKRQGRQTWTLEAEHSSLSSFTRTSSDQLIQGIQLKEKYHDERRGVLYVLAVLDRERAAGRLAAEVAALDERVGLLAGQSAAAATDRLQAVRLCRTALGQRLQADVLRRQIAVISPYGRPPLPAPPTSAQLAARLSELLLDFDIYVRLEEADLLRHAVFGALAATDFNVRMGAPPADEGLTLWGGLNLKWDTYPALSGGEELQVCRAYLSLKIIDNPTGRIVGQVNLMANSNGQRRDQARQRAVRLLGEQVMEQVPAKVYQVLSAEPVD